jgi:hypothetical protein
MSDGLGIQGAHPTQAFERTMTQPNRVYFRIVFIDDEALTTNVSDIVTDDTAVTNQTTELQQSGRQVRISTTIPQKDIRLVPSAESQRLEGYEPDPNLHW